jgi:argininosuccinate lyase
MKLWQKDQESIDKQFERFTIGQDYILDLELATYDIQASKAHVNMLASIALLTNDEQAQLISGLDAIATQIEQGEFAIESGVEDCHSQIELQLTRSLGEVGKKVHSGRSRNDQVLVAMKLFAKAELKEIAGKVAELFELFLTKSEANKNQLMPGYTHMQVAMPSSFGLWFGAYAESLTDDLLLLKAAHQIANKNPLGSAAGYGSSFPLDREMTTKELNFKTPNVNAIYAQMTRGKMEKTTAMAIGNLASTLAKFCMDVCTYSGQDFGFFNLDKAFTTGSSIMPHKQNPDGFELVRAKCNQLQALPYELSMVLTNLSTGYHRDFQVLKERFIPAIHSMKDCLYMLIAMTTHLDVNKEIVSQDKYILLFTVEEVNKLVLAGVPFRDAYKEVGAKVNNGAFKAVREVNHSHLGSIGNLGTDQIRKAFKETHSYFEQQ